MQNYFRNATNVRPIMIQNFLMSQQHHIHVKNYQFLDREFSGILWLVGEFCIFKTGIPCGLGC